MWPNNFVLLYYLEDILYCSIYHFVYFNFIQKYVCRLVSLLMLITNYYFMYDNFHSNPHGITYIKLLNIYSK